MQQVRLWEITSDGKLHSMPGSEISQEERLEDWLADDISVLDPNLMVIGRQVITGFGGKIDLLCLDGNGDTVIVELKKGKTPREVTAQALDYASWINGLNSAEIKNIVKEHSRISGSLSSAFQTQFDSLLPEELNNNHRSIVVAESIDPSTERIVRYLSDMKVPINVVTVQHFKDKAGRSILARVYLIDPEEEEAEDRRPKNRRATMKDIQKMADNNGVGALYSQVKNGVSGVLFSESYVDRLRYKLRPKEGGVRTVLIIHTTLHENIDGAGLAFTVHATRLKEHAGIDLEQLKTWLPATSCQSDQVRKWPGSSEDERNSAIGLEGYLQSQDEVTKFVDGLHNAISQS